MLLTISEFARLLGRDRKTITKAVKLGQIPTIKLGRRKYIEPTEARLMLAGAIKTSESK